MKIGIVTQQIVGNFGGILQNFALQTILKELGHEPITIDYRDPFMTRKEYRKRKWRYIRRTIKFKHPEPVGPRFRQRNSKATDQFVSKYIVETPIVTDYNDKSLLKQKFDCLLVGSDQVWRPEYNQGVMEDMFLNFARNWNVKRIAYAASFGTDKQEFSDNLIKNASLLVSKFEFISVREKSGIDLFETYFGQRPEWVADPTLLIDRIIYNNLISQTYNLDTNTSGKQLFKYVLDKSSQLDRITETLHKQFGIDNIIEIGDQDKSVSVISWLKEIRDAAFVFTDSFHGTIFSIIFHVPFISLCNESRGAERFLSLLKLFGLESRLITNNSQSEIILKQAMMDIDWEDVDNRLFKFREKSMTYLKNALS